MSAPKIVDAVSSVPNTTNVSVPIKLDASALAKALQGSAQPSTTFVDPYVLIKNSAMRMHEMSERFHVLKKLGAELSGKTLTDPLPDSLQVEEVSVKFRIVKDGATSEPDTAVIKNVICVGDLANLLTTEIGAIILMLQQETAAVSTTAKNAEEVCTKAREHWETNNPERKIIQVTPDTTEVAATNDSTPV